jgi:HEAT repeat protein
MTKILEIEVAVKMLNVPGEVVPFKNLKKILQAQNGYDILKVLSGPSYPPSVRRWAIEGLADFSNPEVSKILKQSLKDEFMTVRLHAARAINKRNKTHELKNLIPLLDDESGGIRANVLQIIGHHSYKGLKSKIKKMVNDEKSYIRKKVNELLVNKRIEK